MSFFVQWVWYLLAFLAGSLVAWALAIVTVKRTSADDASTDLPGSREIGDR
jgi:uncharacterized membrane protein ArfB